MEAANEGLFAIKVLTFFEIPFPGFNNRNFEFTCFKLEKLAIFFVVTILAESVPMKWRAARLDD